MSSCFIIKIIPLLLYSRKLVKQIIVRNRPLCEKCATARFTIKRETSIRWIFLRLFSSQLINLCFFADATGTLCIPPRRRCFGIFSRRCYTKCADDRCYARKTHGWGFEVRCTSRANCDVPQVAPVVGLERSGPKFRGS